MAILATERLEEQPTESRLYAMEFSTLLIGSEALSAITSVTCTPTGLTIASTAINGTTVQARLSGGTVDKIYRVEFIVTTDGGNTLESDGELWVHD